LLSEKSTPYFFETRKKDIGKSTAEWYYEHEGTAWRKSTPHFSAITALLKETDGPYFMGGVVSYVDFIWAAVLLFFQTLGDDVFTNVLKASGDDGESFKALLEAVQPWSTRNDF
jgi:glutathione S-transferase